MVSSFFLLAALTLPDSVARATDPIGESSSADLVQLARRRIDHGDYPGARILLDQALAREGPALDEIAYVRGAAWELDGAPERALTLYDEGLERWPSSPYRSDRLFRKAETMGTLGHPEAALRDLHRIDEAQLPGTDRLKYRLVEAILLLDAKRSRRGIRKLRATLTELGDEQLSFYQAKARAALTRELARRSAAFRFDGSERRILKHMEARAELVESMERQVTAIAETLEEPEWVLDGLLTLGSAYHDVGRDLLSAQIPRNLTEDQRALYEAAVRQRVETIWVKAARSYDLGLDMAERLGWTSRRVTLLEDARQTVGTAIEALDTSGAPSTSVTPSEIEHASR